MSFYTLLTLVYIMGGEQLEVKILFADEEDCWSVLLHNDTLYNQINAISGHCTVSEIPSRIVRPEPRPW